MEKEQIKEVLEELIQKAKSISDFHYFDGVLRGLLMAGVLTSKEALTYRGRVQKQIRF